MADCEFEYVDAATDLVTKRCRRCRRIVRSPHPPRQCHARCRVVDLTLTDNNTQNSEAAHDRDPSLARRAGNVIRATGDVVRHLASDEPRPLLLSDAEVERRQAICRSFDYHSPTNGTCRHVACGCRLPIKTRLAAWHCPLGKWPGDTPPSRSEPAAIDNVARRRAQLLMFPHGFGDAVQLTVVLQHLSELHPGWSVDVATKPGTESLFRGLCRRAITWQSNQAWPDADHYDQVAALPWSEPDQTYADSPSTKAEKCLREQFQIAPREDLCRYRIEPTAAHHQRADAYVHSVVGASHSDRAPIVALHYQGNSARARKNINEQIVRRLVDVVRTAGFVPMILDWDRRSRLLDEPDVVNPGAGHALWGPIGTGDGGALAALIARCALVVGIDSGPAHVAAATDTPTLVVWHRHHPVNYFCPADNVTHVVRADQHKYICGNADVGQAYFDAKYRYVTSDAHYRRFLPELIRRRLESL